MDIQLGIATIVIFLGLGMTQIDNGQNEFFVGSGWGTLAMGCLWVAIRVYKSYKKR